MVNSGSWMNVVSFVQMPATPIHDVQTAAMIPKAPAAIRQRSLPENELIDKSVRLNTTQMTAFVTEPTVSPVTN
jgi:hypothetical protein